jgi:hypothetical protein
VHGWDLATAAGATLDLDPVAVGYAFRAIEDMPDVFATFREWGAYAAPVPVPDSVAPTERLLASLGRKV